MPKAPPTCPGRDAARRLPPGIALRVGAEPGRVHPGLDDAEADAPEVCGQLDLHGGGPARHPQLEEAPLGRRATRPLREPLLQFHLQRERATWSARGLLATMLGQLGGGARPSLRQLFLQFHPH